MSLRVFAGLTRGRLRQLWYAPVLALAMGLMLVRLLFMARLLDIPEFGVFSSALLVSGSFCMLACLGLQPLLQRDLPVMIVRRREHAGGVLVMQCALIAAASAAVGVFVVIVGGVSLAGLSPPLLTLGLVHGFSQQLFLVATVDSRSRSRPLLFARQNLQRALVVLGAGAGVALLNGSATAVLAAEAAVSLVLACRLLQRQFHDIPMLPGTAVRLAWRRLPVLRWRQALTLLAVASLGFLVINADRWLAAQGLSASDFAQYAFAWILLMVAQSAQVLINASLYPMLSRRHASHGGNSAFRIAAFASAGLLAAGGVAALPLWALLQFAVTRWFTAYAESLTLLPVFLAIAVLRVSDFWSTYLLVVGREGRLLMLNLLGSMIAVGVWWQLAPVAAYPSQGEIALLALLLAVAGYVVTAAAAWLCARAIGKDAGV